MDALLLSRWQFAITTIYHFLFVPLTLGLTIWVALLETCYVRTQRPHWKEPCRQLVKFFGTLFLINFSLGVVTGIVQEFHFGMNWSEYSRFMGDIFGAPLALEALTAFFLESTFLGIWMFGWDKLSPKIHCLCAWLIAIGSNLSAFWILVANSFMQHPVGYVLQNGRAEMNDFLALVTNPYVVGEYSHALFSGITTAGVLVLVVAGWKYVHDKESKAVFQQVLTAGAIYLAVGVLGVMGSGHMHTQYMAEANPMKLASMEALWENANPAPFAVMAVIDQEHNQNACEIKKSEITDGNFQWKLGVSDIIFVNENICNADQVEEFAVNYAKWLYEHGLDGMHRINIVKDMDITQITYGEIADIYHYDNYLGYYVFFFDSDTNPSRKKVLQSQWLNKEREMNEYTREEFFSKYN